MASFSAQMVFEVYDFIAGYNADYGQIPTLKEMAAAVDSSTTTLTRCLDKMERMGMIRRQDKKARAIRLIRREPNWDALITPEPGEQPPLTFYRLFGKYG